MRQYGLKTGLYTSPHLVSVLERIKLDGKGVNDEIFIKNFWDCWEKLKATRTEEWPLMPGWFRFMTILAFKIFYETRVDVAVIEVGVGGRTDFTNVLNQTAVTGIALLDHDHVDVLGSTLSEIAFHKAGIFKSGVPGIVSPQKDEAIEKIIEISRQVNSPLFKTRQLQQYLDLINKKPSDLNISAEYQLQNVSLAIALADTWLQRLRPDEYVVKEVNLSQTVQINQPISEYRLFELPDEFYRGIKSNQFLGRAQTIDLPGFPIKIFLDGAHTVESIKSALQWYSVQSNQIETTAKCFIFNCNKPRDPKLLLKPLMDLIINKKVKIDYIYFTQSHVEVRNNGDPSNDITYANKDISWQVEISNKWQEMTEEVSSNAKLTLKWPSIEVLPTVNAAIEKAKENLTKDSYDSVELFATGSLYLVGAFLEYVDYPTKG